MKIKIRRRVKSVIVYLKTFEPLIAKCKYERNNDVYYTILLILLIVYGIYIRSSILIAAVIITTSTIVYLSLARSQFLQRHTEQQQSSTAERENSFVYN